MSGCVSCLRWGDCRFRAAMFDIVEQYDVFFNRLAVDVFKSIGVASTAKLYRDVLARSDGCTISILRCARTRTAAQSPSWCWSNPRVRRGM